MYVSRLRTASFCAHTLCARKLSRFVLIVQVFFQQPITSLNMGTRELDLKLSMLGEVCSYTMCEPLLSSVGETTPKFNGLKREGFFIS